MKRVILTAALLLLGSGTARAMDQCDEECPSGQTRVGFADGDHATCQCYEAATAMVDTVPQEADSPSASDGEPTSASAPDPTVVDNSDPNATE
ncbi:MAG: hypothetical protein U0136_15440 [Bdellovibrionota bacterium]